MKMLSAVVGGLVLGAVVVAATPAWADIPPPDACNNVGEECSTAGPQANQPGTCTMAECTRATPQGSMTYECHRCLAPEQGGSGGAGGADGGGAGGATGGSPSENKGGSTTSGGRSNSGGSAGNSNTKDDDGCSIGNVGRQRGVGGMMVALGLAGLLAARRRRSTP